MKIASALIAIFLAASVHAENSGLLPNSSFEEINLEGHPKGWRFFASPKDAVADVPCVTDGKAGKDTHEGLAALQFSFPQGTELVQALWAADPNAGGISVEPGRYSCSFWIKAEDLADEFHIWMQISGYGADKLLLKEVARSGYLKARDFPDGDWSRINFSFEILPDDGIVRIAPSVIFKTSPKSVLTAVPPTTRILVDDVEITKN